MARTTPASGEDSLIARYFRPIATDPGAFQLDDDAAALKADGCDIVVTTLVIHAEDDPWIPVDSYRSWDWQANPAFTLAMTRGGGHVGFHAAGDRTTWYDRRIGAFFEER